MGSTCSSVKKSATSKDGSKSNEQRKESAESIPYGQSSNPEGGGGGDKEIKTEAVSTAQTGDPQSQPPQSAAPTTTVQHSELGATLSSTSSTSTTLPPASATSPPPPQSLSPVPPTTSPSPVLQWQWRRGGGRLSLREHIAHQRPPQSHSLATTSSSTTTTVDNSSGDGGGGGDSGSAAASLDDLYVIALSTESDELVVWSIYEDRAVRTLKGIPRPRDLHMVDCGGEGGGSGSGCPLRAVVLCNRELMLYDLNGGALLTKLKGVMNQKMPYYGLHSEHYVVALSRNRMYVNMINLGTGDLETTFKAGEDRFLNSLLTSANGKICVCGDETQKPFPLLVWDLSARKLQYDLRIPHHEFLTRLSAISNDGHYVVSVCQECNSSAPNFLIVYDLQSGTLFKKWKPESNSVSVAISTRCGGSVMNGTANHDVLVWDLSTGNIKYTLSGHTAPPDLLHAAEKANAFLSYNSTRADPQLRVWSLEQGTCLWTYNPLKELSCCCLTPNGLAIVYGCVGEKRLHLAVRTDEAKSEAENEQFKVDYLARMRSKLVPFGDERLLGSVTDLKTSS
ncbi:hypothetical protein TYRP_005102 [Tyrophagus putrescentiae]|nr:hypothetical protein TYRP_005102 [Tyrophagus putrescentiae]